MVSGYELCEWLRNKEGMDLPVLMLTARDTLNDKLKVSIQARMII